MAKKLYEESNIQAIANAIRTKTGGTDKFTTAQMAGAIGAIDTSSFTKLYEGTITANTSSTSATNLTTITVPGAYAAERLLVRITDTAGRRNGYFYCHEDYFRNYYNENRQTTTLTYGARFGMYVNTSGQIQEYVGATTTAYGVYAYSITSKDVIQLRTRYNNSYSLTINGTYRVEVFAYNAP